MCKIKHLCWDFDGTLYNTYEKMVCSMLYALGDLGLYAEPSDVYALLKVSVYHTCQVLSQRLGIPIEQISDAFGRHHRQESGWQPYAGTEICLYQLRRMGCKHYLYTHRDATALRQLTADGLAGYFTDFIIRDSGFPDKPAPDALLHLQRKHGFSPEEAVMVGDRDIDIGAGHAAGMRGILFDPDRFYPELEAEYHADSMAAILMLVKNTPVSLPADPG